MAIEGLMVPRSTPEIQANLFKPGTPDVTEAVGVTLELYKELGFAGDADKATEDLTRDFTALTELGYDGRLFVPAPVSISFDALLRAVEGKRPKGVDEAGVYDPFWIPGTEDESVKHAQLNAAPREALARLALFNFDTKTDVDPLLHYLGLPFDEYSKERWGGSKTQLQAVKEGVELFGAQHAGFSLNEMDHRDEMVLAGMDRIRDIDSRSDAFVLNRGYMRIPDLGRRAVHRSLIGVINSDFGNLYFGICGGDADPDSGIGLTAGQMSAEAMALRGSFLLPS